MPPSIRSHGLQRPLDRHQLGAWALLASLFALHFALHTPLFSSSPGGLVLTLLFSLSCALLLLFGYKTTVTDPSDEGARARREGRRSADDAPAQPHPPPAAGSNYCYLCEATVGRRSKHCRRCKKCVAVFDHHCPWVNNCVGAGNYRYFLLMLTGAFAMTGLQLGCAVQACVSLADPDFVARLAKVMPRLPPFAYGVLVGLGGLAALIAGLLVSQLLFFHLGLIYRGATTYEFIVSQRQKMIQQTDKKRTPLQRCGDEVQNNAPCLTMCQLCFDEQLKKRAAAQRAAKDAVRPPKTPGSSVRISGYVQPSTRRSGSSAFSFAKPRAAASTRTNGTGVLKASPEQQARVGSPRDGLAGRVNSAPGRGDGGLGQAPTEDEESFPLRIPSYAVPSEVGSDRSSSRGRTPSRLRPHAHATASSTSSALRSQPLQSSTLAAMHPSPESGGHRVRLPPIGSPAPAPAVSPLTVDA